MSLFINCAWYPENDMPLEERIGRVVEVLSSAVVRALMGEAWYRTGRSRKQALSRPMPLDELKRVEHWRHKQLGPGSSQYRMDLWNGLDAPSGVALMLTINDPSESHDALVFEGPELDAPRAAHMPWDTILACGEFVARELGGLAKISSHELMDHARAQGLARAERAAYATFWGIDRSGKNPGYRALPPGMESGPHAMVVARTWEEVETPDIGRVEESIRLRSSAQGGAAPLAT